MADIRGREAWEARIARRLAEAQQEELELLLEALGEIPDLANVPEAFWLSQASHYREVLFPLFVDLFLERVEQSTTELKVGVDPALMNSRASEWAQRATFEQIQFITDTTRKNLQVNLAAFANGFLDLGELTALIARDFGPTRASTIAITETTRVLSNGEQTYRKELAGLGLKVGGIWNTNQDSLVCEICGPKDRQPVSIVGHPPGDSHNGCRCWESTVIL